MTDTITRERIAELREQASRADRDSYTSLHWREMLSLLDLVERSLDAAPVPAPGLFDDLRGVSKPPVEAPHFWESGRQFPHSYEEDGTSDCAHGCGGWAGPSRSGGPDGVDPFGECPAHPDRKTAA